jgi:hypothetical protein
MCCPQVLWFFTGLADVAEPAAAALSRGRLLLPLTAGHFNAALRGSAAPLDVAEWRLFTASCGGLILEQRTLAMFWQVGGSRHRGGASPGSMLSLACCCARKMYMLLWPALLLKM